MNDLTVHDSSFPALRRFMRPRKSAEHCELCGVDLEPGHGHLVEPVSRRIVCACDACAILFAYQSDGRFRRVPTEAWCLSNFRLTDAQWDDLHVPINLVFFFRSGPSGKVAAFYPSPAGPMESLLPLETWQDLERENPILRKLAPDIEALLVKRIGESHEYFRVPIDLCYQLVGLIRSHWRGFSGGTEVWAQITRFFEELRDKCVGAGGEA